MQMSAYSLRPEEPLLGTLAEDRHHTYVLTRPLTDRTAVDGAELWLASELGTGRDVVITAGTTESGAALVRREIERRLQLRDTRFVTRLFDGDGSRDASSPWFATERATRGSVEEVYGTQGSRSLSDVLWIGLNLVNALEETGVVHRDLRPSNVLLTVEEEAATLSLRVSGWARSVVPGGEQPRELAPADAAYAAPQVFDPSAYADVRDDLLSVAAIIWWCCTGNAPGVSSSSYTAADAWDLARSRQHAPRLDQLTPAPRLLGDLVQQLLEPERDDRLPEDVDGHHESLQWVRDQLRACEAEISHATHRFGRPVLVGPQLMSTTGGSPALRPGAKATDPLALERGSGRASTGTDLVAQYEQPAARMRPDEGTGTAMVAAPRRRPLPPSEVRRAPRPNLSTSEADAGASRAKPRNASPRRTTRVYRAALLWVALLVVIHVAGGLLVFSPGSTISAQVTLLGVLAVAVVVGAFDLLLVRRLAVADVVSPWPRSSVRLLAIRAVIALVLAVVIGNAVVARLLSQELDAQRSSQRAHAIAQQRAELTAAGTRVRRQVADATARREHLLAQRRQLRARIARREHESAARTSGSVAGASSSDATTKVPANTGSGSVASGASGSDDSSSRPTRTETAVSRGDRRRLGQLDGELRTATAERELALARRDRFTASSEHAFAELPEVASRRDVLGGYLREHGFAAVLLVMTVAMLFLPELIPQALVLLEARRLRW